METETGYRDLPLEALKESKHNPRRSFDKKALEDLERSVRETGKVLVPLLVRPNGTGSTYEILAGARRFRVAKTVGLANVPCRILSDLTDAQALEVMVIENLQRADVHPLEEAAGYRELMKAGNYDAEAVATKVGMSAKYVYDRLKLLELGDKALKLFREGRIEAGHAILLARLDGKEQDEVLKHQGWRINQGDLSVRDLQQHIRYRKEQEKWKAEAAARRKKDAAEVKSGKKKSFQQLAEERDAKWKAEEAARDLKRKAEKVARVATVQAVLVKVKWPLPKGVYRIIADDTAGKLKEAEIPRAIVASLCGRFAGDYCYEDDIRAIKMLANIYGVKVVKPEKLQTKKATPAPTPKAKKTSNKKKLQTSAKKAA